MPIRLQTRKLGFSGAPGSHGGPPAFWRQNASSQHDNHTCHGQGKKQPPPWWGKRPLKPAPTHAHGGCLGRLAGTTAACKGPTQDHQLPPVRQAQGQAPKAGGGATECCLSRQAKEARKEGVSGATPVMESDPWDPPSVAPGGQAKLTKVPGPTGGPSGCPSKRAAQWCPRITQTPKG